MPSTCFYPKPHKRHHAFTPWHRHFAFDYNDHDDDIDDGLLFSSVSRAMANRDGFDNVIDLFDNLRRPSIMGLNFKDEYNKCMNLTPFKSIKVDCQEASDGTLQITADVPGFNKDEITLDIKDNILTLSAEKIDYHKTQGNTDASVMSNIQAISNDTEKSSAIPENNVNEEEDNLSMVERLRISSERSIFDNQEDSKKDDQANSHDTRSNSMTESSSNDKSKISTDASSPAMNTSMSKVPQVYWQERQKIQKFTRSFRLPKNFDEANIAASLDNGVLHIKVPCLQERKTKKRPIEIKSLK